MGTARQEANPHPELGGRPRSYSEQIAVEGKLLPREALAKACWDFPDPGLPARVEGGSPSGHTAVSDGKGPGGLERLLLVSQIGVFLSLEVLLRTRSWGPWVRTRPLGSGAGRCWVGGKQRRVAPASPQEREPVVTQSSVACRACVTVTC